MSQITFTRVSNDVNGNPRYVCHFLNLMGTFTCSVEDAYKQAIKKAKTIGGKKFHNKQYGGGIVFQSYNIADTERKILELVNQ
jgi:predicted SpoU family rRNA methylase